VKILPARQQVNKRRIGLVVVRDREKHASGALLYCWCLPISYNEKYTQAEFFLHLPLFDVLHLNPHFSHIVLTTRRHITRKIIKHKVNICRPVFCPLALTQCIQDNRHRRRQFWLSSWQQTPLRERQAMRLEMEVYVNSRAQPKS